MKMYAFKYSFLNYLNWTIQIQSKENAKQKYGEQTELIYTLFVTFLVVLTSDTK